MGGILLLFGLVFWIGLNCDLNFCILLVSVCIKCLVCCGVRIICDFILVFGILGIRCRKLIINLLFECVIIVRLE